MYHYQFDKKSLIFIHIVETADATAPEVTIIQVQMVPTPDPNEPFTVPPPLEDDHEPDPDDSFQLGRNHTDDNDDDNEGTGGWKEQFLKIVFSLEIVGMPVCHI